MTAKEILEQAKGRLNQSIEWLETTKTRQIGIMKTLTSEDDKKNFDKTLQKTQHELYKCSVLSMKLDNIQL